MRERFHGVREHLICTPNGRIVALVQIPGRRHDVQGLYALLNTSFRGHLIGDNAYWPQLERDPELVRAGIIMTAATRRGFKFRYPPEMARALAQERHQIERYINHFNEQLNAARTLNRSLRHYLARRWTKALAFNATKHFNQLHGYPVESFSHLRAIA